MRRRRWAQWGCACLALCALLWAAAAWAQPVVTLDPARPEVPVGRSGQAWIDATGEAVVDAVAADRSLRWQSTAPGTVYPLDSRQALWFRFSVAETSDSERWYLEIPYPAVNRVTLFTPDRSSGRWLAQSAGDALPVAAWPLPHRHPLLPLALSVDAPQTFLLRVENPHSFSAPLAFVSEAALVRQEQRTSLILGIYFGLAGLAAVLATLGAAWLRDSAFAWYALALVVMGLAQSSMTGVAGLHLWPRAPWWNDVSALALPVLAVGSLMWFVTGVMSLRQRAPTVWKLHLALALLSVPVAAAILSVEASWRFRVMVPYVAVASTVTLTTLVWIARRGDRHAGWLLAGMVPVVVLAIFPLARTAGLIPISFWTAHGMQVAIAIELPLLLVVLMARSQHRRENTRRLQGLDRIDPATGLINAAVFEERLQHMMARSERLRHKSAVLLVDLLNLDDLRRQFDRRAADEMPLRVAGRLLSAARDIDSVARLSGNRFGMLVEGPLTAEDVASTGPKVVARCLMPFKDRPLEYVAQVRVAQMLVPTGDGPAGVLQRLESVLATVPADSRRAVFTIR